MIRTEAVANKSYKWLLAGFLFLASALNYGDRTAMTALYPLIQKEFDLSDIGVGAIGSAFLWSYAISSPIAGLLADRFSRARLIVISLFAWSVVTALTGRVHSSTALWTMRGVLGIVESLYLPASIAILAAHHSVATRATAIGIHLAGLSVGMIAGGTISGYLATHYGWRVPLFVLGGGGVVVALIGCFVVRDFPITDSSSETREHSRSTSLADSLSGLARALRNPAVLALCFEIMFMGAGVWGLINWLPLYFHDTFDMSLAKAALFGSLFLQTGAMLGVIVGGWPSDYLARRGISRRMLLFGCFYLAASPWSLVFLAHPAVWTVSAAVFLFGLLRSMGAVNSNPLICELLPSRMQATAIGFMNMLACVAGGAGVLVAGALKHSLGLSGVFASISVVTSACAVAILLVGLKMWGKREVGAISELPGGPSAIDDNLCSRNEA